MFKKLFFASLISIQCSLGSIAFAMEAQAPKAIQLDESHIQEYKAKIAKDFLLRQYLAKGTKVVGAATAVWIAYKWGLLDGLIKCVFPGKEKPEIMSKEFMDKFAELAKQVAEIKDRLPANPADKPAIKIENAAAPVGSTVNFLMKGIKALGSQTMSIMFWIVINTKIQHFYEYAFAKPSFEWFFAHHSVLATIDGVRRNIQVITDVNVPAEYTIEYHNRALNPALQSIARTLEEFIAFIDYYVDRIDQDIVHEQAMDTVSRYIFNIANDFLKKIDHIMHGSTDQSMALALVNDFKSDITHVIHRCRIFEKEFVDQA